MPEESIVHPVLFTLDFVLFVIAFRNTSLGKLAEITIPMFFLSAFIALYHWVLFDASPIDIILSGVPLARTTGAVFMYGMFCAALSCLLVKLVARKVITQKVNEE